MFKKLVPVLLFGAVTAGFMVNAGASNHQITICHATASETNPYVAVHPTKQQIYDDHGHRTGQESVHPGDIIPPFAAGSHGGQEWGAFPGQNWDAQGQATWNNSCQPVPPTTTTVQPTTTTAPTTTTTEPEPTTTTVPPIVGGGRPITTPPTPPAVVEGEVITRPTPEVDQLPRTGAEMAWLVVAGLGALVLGMLAQRKSRQLLRVGAHFRN